MHIKNKCIMHGLRSFDHLLYGSWFEFGIVRGMVVHLTKSEVGLFFILQGNMVTVAKLPKGRIDLTRKVLLELKQVFIMSYLLLLNGDNLPVLLFDVKFFFAGITIPCSEFKLEGKYTFLNVTFTFLAKSCKEG